MQPEKIDHDCIQEWARFVFEPVQETYMTDMTVAIGHMMTQKGGSFERALGQLLLLADADNRKKIWAAFPSECWRFAGWCCANGGHFLSRALKLALASHWGTDMAVALGWDGF